MLLQLAVVLTILEKNNRINVIPKQEQKKSTADTAD